MLLREIGKLRELGELSKRNTIFLGVFPYIGFCEFSKATYGS